MRYLFFGILLLPHIVLGVTTPTTFKGFVGLINGLIDIVIPLLFGLIFIVFLWKIVSAWILNAGNEKSVEEGKHVVIVGVLVFVVLTSIWGILRLLRYSFFGV